MTKDKTGPGYIPEKPGKIDVGIVGAGVAGLLFDWLNGHPDLKGKDLKINYDILEAAGADRLGGRLHTHHFSDKEHDYYNVGAMRFPNNTIMKRDQHMSGAFAYFGPGQFSNMWQEIIKPNSFGQLYLVGEAASSHHAWIVGALESVIRAVYVMFQGLQNGNKDFDAYGIVLNLLRNVPAGNDEKNVGLPLKKDGALPTGLPFHPLPEEMPERQLCTPKNRDLTDSPEKEASKKEVHMTYGAALAVLSLIESFFELGLDQNDQY
ncbi:hypothetical protein Neosp_003244 [[Neocosmospora] mangrovei]